jgi:nucleoside-diphosphate-sugar epimerase
MKILILGVNGFIGNSLVEQILAQTDWEVYGMDLSTSKLTASLNHPRFHFTEGDITIHQEWVQYHIKKCDVILPLVAIATPATYVQDPLRIFELDFEANLKIIRLCAQYKKRLIHPSTSEVYGMCPDNEFDEENSVMVTGPINKQRCIYSCSKQLLDRVIYALGIKENLNYTLFRPFNWLGPKLDNILDTSGSSRVITQFISNILHGKNIQLVGGGEQRRCFTDIDDGIDALLRIIANKENCAERRIFNIGNPFNNLSVRELAELIIREVKNYPNYANAAAQTQLISVSSDDYYGKGYQDVGVRVPAIKNAQEYLGWEPKVDMQTALKKTLDYHLV